MLGLHTVARFTPARPEHVSFLHCASRLLPQPEASGLPFSSTAKLFQGSARCHFLQEAFLDCFLSPLLPVWVRLLSVFPPYSPCSSLLTNTVIAFDCIHSLKTSIQYYLVFPEPGSKPVPEGSSGTVMLARLRRGPHRGPMDYDSTLWGHDPLGDDVDTREAEFWGFRA